jgi:hypothetical protein
MIIENITLIVWGCVAVIGVSFSIWVLWDSHKIWKKLIHKRSER